MGGKARDGEHGDHDKAGAGRFGHGEAEDEDEEGNEEEPSTVGEQAGDEPDGGGSGDDDAGTAGMVAGSGAATAPMAGTPRRARMGEAKLEPPTPNNPTGRR